MLVYVAVVTMSLYYIITQFSIIGNCSGGPLTVLTGFGSSKPPFARPGTGSAESPYERGPGASAHATSAKEQPGNWPFLHTVLILALHLVGQAHMSS